MIIQLLFFFFFKVCVFCSFCSGVTGGGGGGAGDRIPPRLLTGKFLLTYREKRGKEKGEMEQKRRKIEKGKVIKWKWKEEKLQNEERTFFFFFFSLLKTTKICFESNKMGIFYWEKAFHVGKKSGKMTLPPLKNIPLTHPVICIEDIL